MLQHFATQQITHRKESARRTSIDEPIMDIRLKGNTVSNSLESSVSGHFVPKQL
jgi:hypothetical protein